MKERNYTIDLLRVLGTFTVIMAHIDPPNLLFQIRAFDVLMLVFISGMSFVGSSKYTYKEYLIRRCDRLLKPTYICMTTLFLLCYACCSLLNKEQLYTIEDIGYSFILSDHGMGYIWIVKVYLLIALFSPFLNKVCKNTKITWSAPFLFVIAIALQHVLLNITPLRGNILFSDYLLYIIPYCLVAYIGMLWNDITNLTKLLIIGISFTGVMIHLYIDGSFAPNSYKFPADYQYVSYGVLGSVVTYGIAKCASGVLKKADKYNVCKFLSINSFNIYLCHIIIMLAFNMITKALKIYCLNTFIVHYIIVLFASILLTVVINIVKSKIKKHEQLIYK